ncbi:glycoside hydrolase family 2 protein [Cohnella thailandensis]|uniref:Glycoside hydrolase family 2 n=1 Tax=Cohnella thailandensis TaxID=557557 RepID=A0A841T3R8_9BACL|nr:sugar-binding domain-containing protein [Cohnella thailandensis]MBB6635761.1 glycoside hydrolase family 2 [Cohnella thailandensis]MBP1976139.1 beta-galactosidase/beta-glucuronidase [Cohnella thailandensis]
MSIRSYRKEYPRPQFVRAEWQNLNGEWDFRFDDGNVGENERWYENLETDVRIQVPFVYETKASGIGESKFHPYVWYQRSFSVPADALGKRILLNFQAVDYAAKVWVNGEFVGTHEGGYAAFSFDITRFVSAEGENRIVVKAEDSDDVTQPRGKQRWRTDNFGCWYVQTTGIWQTVWLEYVSDRHLQSVKMTPDLDTSSVKFDYRLGGGGAFDGVTLTTKITLDGEPIKQTSIAVDRSSLSATVELISDKRVWRVEAWRPANPKLYEVEFVLADSSGAVLDEVQSYFGLRKVSIQKGKVLLNNEPIYQRLILDQGYWTDSHLTPPSEEAILEDIDRILEMGYNGVRKHQKIEDPRFLYWCDVKGLLVWSEMAAAYEFNDRAVDRFTREWLDIVRQQYNHPSIVTWVPFNESWGIANVFADRRQQQFTESIYHLTKAIDPNRPVIVNDGWEHTVSDILTLHDYEESGERFLKRYADKDAITSNEIPHSNFKYAMAQGYAYRGQPIIISEFGGIAFKSEEGWGYGNQVDSEEAFLDRFARITQAIKDTDYICGYCYTQVTDVQQEVNGLLGEDRQPKVPLDRIRAINMA